MTSKALEMSSNRTSDACSPESNSGVESCSQELANRESKMVQTAPSESTTKLLAGFSIEPEKIADAAIVTGASAALLGLGGAGAKYAEIGAHKFTASVFDLPLRAVGGAMRWDALASGQVAREIIEAPYGPRVTENGLKFAKLGAKVGLVAYGLYEGYNYLTKPSDK